MDKILFSEVDKHHIYCSLNMKVRDICQPLFANIAIDFYTFERFYYDGTYSTPSSALEMH